jgi:DNA-binding winged helix-turn-helix (wHTH) protein
MGNAGSALTKGSLPPRGAPVRFGDFTLDLDGHSLSNADGGDIPLTQSEFALLREFIRHPGRVLSRGYLLDALAGKRADPFDRSIDMLVGRLRRKIEPATKPPRLIVTVPGEGYKFAAPIRVEALRAQLGRRDGGARDSPKRTAAAASFDRRPALREYRRKPGAGAFRRRGH